MYRKRFVQETFIAYFVGRGERIRNLKLQSRLQNFRRGHQLGTLGKRLDLCDDRRQGKALALRSAVLLRPSPAN